jgi:hypothetical protein
MNKVKNLKETMLYNNYNETRIQFDWSIAVQDQAIVHEELKCVFLDCGFSKCHCFTVVIL